MDWLTPENSDIALAVFLVVLVLVFWWTET